ncbi:hypothetical protein DT075_16515 [Bacillus licheniformis]|nr:hypothetical protein DT075_16515 [Bacillus licheniformis]
MGGTDRKLAKVWSEKTTRESYQIQAGDKYKNFKELQENEKSGYDIDYHEKAGSDCLIFSPHGGRIEGGVSELVRAFTFIKLIHN